MFLFPVIGHLRPVKNGREPAFNGILLKSFLVFLGQGA